MTDQEAIRSIGVVIIACALLVLLTPRILKLMDWSWRLGQRLGERMFDRTHRHPRDP